MGCEDYRPVVKSVGHGTTTKADLTSNEEVWITILELSQDIGHRLKKLGMNCMGISICIRNEDLMHKEWQQKLNFATQSPFVIAKLAYALFLQKYVWNKNIRSVTVRAINLISDSAPMQLDLFVDQDSMTRQTKIDNCIESLRARFGSEIIKNAVLLKNVWMMNNQAKLTMPTGMANMR